MILDSNIMEGDDSRNDAGDTADAATEAKSGWADSMAKILGSNKPKNKKTLILSRAKKDFEVRKVIERADGAKIPAPIPVVRIDEEKDTEIEVDTVSPPKKAKASGEDESVLSVKAQRKLELQQRKQLREWENINRTKPDLLSPEEKVRERELIKIATKGVVQLFNAVNLQQKSIKDKLSGVRKSEFKRDKVLHQSKEIFDSAMTKSKRIGGTGDYSSDSEDDEADMKEEEESDSDFEHAAPTGSITFKSSSGSISTALNGSKTKKAVKPKQSSRKPGFKALHDDYMLKSVKLKDWNDNAEEDSD